MFAVRIVYGPNKGKYYGGFETNTNKVNYVDNVDKSEKLLPRDTAGIIMGLIDQRLEVAVPESVTATEEDCDECAKMLAQGMWSGNSGIAKVINAKVIRRKASTPIHEQLEGCPEGRHDSGYMSVWEWLTKAMNLHNDEK